MNKFKLLSSTILSIAITLFFTACGETSNFFLSMQEAAAIKNYDYESEISFTANGTFKDSSTQPSSTEETDDINVKVKLCGTILENNDFNADVFVVFDSNSEDEYMKMFRTNGEYLNLTDIVFKDDTLYININKARKALSSLGLEEYAMILKSFDAEYIEFGLDTIEDYGLTIKSENIDESGEAMGRIYLNLLKLIETTIKDVAPSLLSEKGGVYTFTLNNENIPALIDAVTNLLDNGLDDFLDESIAELENIDNEQAKQLVGEIKQARETLSSDDFKTSAKEQLDELKSVIAQNGGTFEIIGASAVGGKEGSREWDFTIDSNIEQDKNAETGYGIVVFNLNHSIKELADDSIISRPVDSVIFN